MADLIDRAAMLEIVNKINVADDTFGKAFGVGAQVGVEIAANKIKKAPAVDAVPVVRCGECRYFFVDEDYAKHGLCRAYPLGIAKLPMDYCSLGERRTDATD